MKPSMREIKYWLVLNIREYLHGCGTKQFYCLQGTTDNPKLAMRYHTEEGAQQQAHAMGWQWSAVEHSFPGDEIAL